LPAAFEWPLHSVTLGSGQIVGARTAHRKRMLRSNVRFTPESDIKCDIWKCPLWAKSGHFDRA
jgi:hypothetical protein